jgi:N-6 DNA Methylase
LADHEDGAHYRLIQAIVEADQSLDGHNKPIMRRLLVLTVLIKYLEDRRVFPEEWFAGFHQEAQSFFDVLASNDPDKVLDLLAALRDKFRGDLFTLPGDMTLDKAQLSSFATLVEARTLGRQRFLWEQYSFQHLPVEVISRIYQRFVSDGRGAFYTPPILATMLLDHGLPYHKLRGDERILDPSCGSGIFLVGAFKRLVNVWRHRHGGKAPSVASLKKILRESIFGIELHPGAVNLAAFSLALAICDALKPNVIWNQLQFDPVLGTNLLGGDFFELFDEGEPLPLLHPRRWPTNEGWPGFFDLIIGNPPFESSLTAEGKAVDAFLVKRRGKLPDHQAAYLFLEQASKLINENGRLCLLQPSGFLYNRKTARFRKNFFRQVNCEEILDFTSIRKLFDGADTKTIAIHARGVSPDQRLEMKEGRQRSILHLTFRRTFSTTQRIGFELDHYDRHRIRQADAEKSLFIWRINLLGGGRLVEMSERFASMRTLSDYIKSKGWKYGEGFTVGNERHEVDFLNGLPDLPTEALTDEGIDESAIGKIAATRFENPRNLDLFSSPLIVIKEHADLPLGYWTKSSLAFRDQIIGIHAEASEETELRSLYETIKRRRRLYQFCCLLNGSKVLVDKATAILKQDIDALPFPEDEIDLDLAFWEKAIVEDVLDYMAPFIRLGQNSELLEQAAPIEHLQKYATMFCQMLGTVYENLKSSEAIHANGLICQPFYFGRAPRINWKLDGKKKQLERLIYKQDHGSLRTVRVVRFYDENVMLIVKPDRLRYWIRSTAIRDADETLLDLRRQGY